MSPHRVSARDDKAHRHVTHLHPQRGRRNVPGVAARVAQAGRQQNTGHFGKELQVSKHTSTHMHWLRFITHCTEAQDRSNVRTYDPKPLARSSDELCFRFPGAFKKGRKQSVASHERNVVQRNEILKKTKTMPDKTLADHSSSLIVRVIIESRSTTTLPGEFFLRVFPPQAQCAAAMPSPARCGRNHSSQKAHTQNGEVIMSVCACTGGVLPHPVFRVMPLPSVGKLRRSTAQTLPAGAGQV